jgi:hypothetical protein
LRKAISEAEARLAEMQEEIDRTAKVEDAVAEAAANALERGANISAQSKAWRAKEERDGLITEHALLKTGFARLQSRAGALENKGRASCRDRKARTDCAGCARYILADGLFAKENEAAQLRTRLLGFSMCANGGTPQKLSWRARALLLANPKNATYPQINSPEQRAVDRDKQAFIAWRALESDAQAQLYLEQARGQNSGERAVYAQYLDRSELGKSSPLARPSAIMPRALLAS